MQKNRKLSKLQPLKRTCNQVSACPPKCAPFRSQQLRAFLHALLTCSQCLRVVSCWGPGQDHYPEIFGDVYFYYPPQKICCFWSFVGPLLDQRVRAPDDSGRGLPFCSCTALRSMPPQVRDKVVLVTSGPQWRQLLNTTFDAERCLVQACLCC